MEKDSMIVRFTALERLKLPLFFSAHGRVRSQHGSTIHTGADLGHFAMVELTEVPAISNHASVGYTLW